MKLTIFTPTYNRGNELKLLYENIKEESEIVSTKDYLEWLIIDDGSLDNTEKIVGSFSIESVDIRYIKKNNGGKHTAFNLAIELCTGDIFVCIDDDDRLSRNALPQIFECAKKYDNGNYGAVVGRVMDTNNTLLGETKFEDILISNTIEIRDKYGFWGEPEVFYTKFLKNYRFDIFDNEKFLTEAYVFDLMSLEHPFVYTNINMMVKHYLKDGLTDNQLKIRIESPIGAEEYYFKRSILCTGFFHKLKATINRQRFAYWISQNTKHREINFYEIIANPFSKILYFRDKFQYHNNK